MKNKIEEMLKKYIKYKKSGDAITTIWEGELNHRIVMVRYSESFNKLFCGIENGCTYLTGYANKKGSTILKKFEKQLQHLYLKELN